MSLKLNERYPGRFDIPSADYPQGAFKNRTTPDAKDGSYLEKDWANDKEGFFQSLLDGAGIVPNGQVDKVGSSQNYDALLQTITDVVGGANAGYLEAANNLSDVDDVVEARANLQLGTAAIVDAQTHPTDDTVGRVLRTGAYGWGQGGITLTDGTDLNNVVTAGVYRVNTGPNVPVGGEYSPMLVIVGQDTLAQMIIGNQSGTIYTRGCITSGAGFGPWATNNPASIFSMPVGMPFPWPAFAPPAGCLAMSGQAFDPLQYPVLASLYPTNVLPDMRGEWIRGWDNSRGVDPSRALLSAQLDQFENHTHFNQAAGWVVSGGNDSGGAGVAFGQTGASSAVSGKAGTETRPRNIAFNFVCRAF